MVGPCFGIVICLMAANAAAQSQSTGADLVGVVVDETQGVLADVELRVVSETTSLARMVTTDLDGRYAVRALPVGSYEVSARRDGFEPLIVPAVVMPLGTSVVLNLTLKIAGLRYDVAVAATEALADAQRPGVGKVIDRAQLDVLPVNVRNFLSFSLLTPTTAPDRTPQQGASRTSGLVFAGQRPRANNIVVDGLDNNDEVVGSVRAVFSQEAVGEFQVLADGYSAEFGKAAGGVVNIVTRSGTNRFEAGAFAFFRNDELSARNYFERYTSTGQPVDMPKAPYGQSQVGATFGGPIRRDRTFFFSSIEHLTADANNFVTIDDRTQVPDPRQPGAVLGTAADILRRAGFPIEVGHSPYRLRSTQVLVKLDYLFDASHRLAVRINGASELNENIEPFGGLVARSRAAALDNSDLMVAATYHLASDDLVNEARVLVAARNQDVQALDPTCLDACDREDEGGPTVEVAGVANAGRHRFTPTPRDNVRYQMVDTVSYAGKRHLFKTGVDLSVIDGRRQALPLHFGGRYIFTALNPVPGLLPTAVSSIQAVALGIPLAYVQGYGVSGSAYDTADLSLFAEDTWDVGRRLSVRYGARYQRQFWPDDDYRVAGIAEPYRFPSDGNNLAPRVAATWTPDAAANLVVRGGYGVYYENTITSTAGIAQYVNGAEDGVRTLVLPAPSSILAWAAPGHRLSEPAATAIAGGRFASATIAIDPGFQTGYAHQAFAALERRSARLGTVAATVVFARGYNQLGTIDYNPVIPALGAGRRPLDVAGVPGTSASVLQYTAFGETWYRGLTLSSNSRLPRGGRLQASYTVSKAEDTSTDFQSQFLPENNGRGRDASNPEGLPLDFHPDRERGPALHDQRHRLVVTATAESPGGFRVSGIVTVASGWPYNILAGSDLNGDRDGGSFPTDRARRTPADPATSIERNSGRLPAQATIDMRVSKIVRIGPGQVEGLVEIFNLFNRANFNDVQNVFGTGAYPQEPGSTFGQFTQAAAPRQVQLGVRVRF